MNEAPFSEQDRAIIRQLAAGDTSMRAPAIAIFRSVLRGKKPSYHEDPYFAFMSEIDNPVPCYVLKGNARAQILGGKS